MMYLIEFHQDVIQTEDGIAASGDGLLVHHKGEHHVVCDKEKASLESSGVAFNVLKETTKYSFFGEDVFSNWL